MERTITITLQKPLANLTEITLREPTVDEMAQFTMDTAKFGEPRAAKSLIAKIGQVEVADVGQLGTRDYGSCQRFVNGLLEANEQVLDGDEATLTLSTPLPGLAEIKLREPTLDQFARLTTESEKLGEIIAARNLIAAMNKLEPKLVGRMGVSDFKACDRYIARFFD